jgi:hypothetical protein
MAEAGLLSSPVLVTGVIIILALSNFGMLASLLGASSFVMAQTHGQA